MNTEQTLQMAETFLQPMATAVGRPAPERLDVKLPAAQLATAVEALIRARIGYLSAITGLDCPPAPSKAGEPATGGGVEALYHFCQGAAVITLRVAVPYDAARIPSICHLVPSATLYERELSEMLGITVEGTPVRDHLLLPENWPDGVCPLRKSFAGKIETTATGV